MLTLKKKTASLLADAIDKRFGSGILTADEIFDMLEYPPDKAMGDLALPCFRLSRGLRRAPAMIASELASAFE